MWFEWEVVGVARLLTSRREWAGREWAVGSDHSLEKYGSKDRRKDHR